MANTSNASRYFSCFLSYGQPDIAFARKLVGSLEAKGVSCWFYGGHATPGARTHQEIAEQRRNAERVIILCSYKSLIQEGVLSEIDDQIREGPEKLIPVSLDDVWQHSGFRVQRGARDLKPLLLERNYADFREPSAYDVSLAKLVGALERKALDLPDDTPSPAAIPAPPTAGRMLEKRVAGIGRLLKLRGDAKDLSFAPQILDELASVLVIKYGLLGAEELDEPRVYLKLIRYLNTAPQASRAALKHALENQDFDINQLALFLQKVSEVINRDDRSPDAVALVHNRLPRLYTLVAALVADEVDKKDAEAKVQIAAQQEGDYIEYKSSLRYNMVRKQVDKAMELEVVTTIAGLANHQGGTLYIGVNDKGEIVGTDPDLSTFQGDNPMDKFRLHFDQLVTQRFGVQNYQILEAEWAEPEGKKVFVVRVKPWSVPVFADGDFYLRRGARTVKLNAQQFFDYFPARWGSQSSPPASSD